MPRSPEPGDACRPGGSCPDCNAKPKGCQMPFCTAEAEPGEDYCRFCLDQMAEDACETPSTTVWDY
jgi:hypothetical protein